MPMTVHIFTGKWDVPSESPFCLKLLTWMRMAGIPYETSALSGPAKSRSGKAPYLEREDGSMLEDSSAIIETLRTEYVVKLDAERTPEQRATMTMIQRTVETHLYFAILLHRWRDHWPEIRRGYFEGIIPAPLLLVAGPLIRRGTIKQAHGQGMGRMAWSQAIIEAKDDLLALSVLLGDRDYFLGTPGLTDAIVYGFLENIRVEPMGGPLADALRGHANLTAWLDRMKARYWE